LSSLCTRHEIGAGATPTFGRRRRRTALIPIQVLRVLVSQPLVILDQAGRLENAAYTQWAAHAVH